MAAQRILVIEDESGARNALGILLAEDGYTVCTAETGRAGLARLRDFHPDTVVCDFFLPDINGLQVLRQAREATAGRLTFIVVTAGCASEDAERALRSEADHFFRKPVDLRRFRRVLERSSSGRAHSPHANLSEQGATHGGT